MLSAARHRTRSLILEVDTTASILSSSSNLRNAAKRRHLSSPSIFITTSGLSCNRKRDIISFSFDSSGWLYVYHLGVAKYLKENFDLQHSDVRFYGCSAGSIVACCLAIGISPEVVFQRAIQCWKLCKFNPFKMFSLVEKSLKEWVPEEAHLSVSERLSISLAKVTPQRKLFTVSRVAKFESREHLISAVRASCHIPIVGGVLPYHVKGTGYCYDGGLVERIPLSPTSDSKEAELLNETCITISASGLETAHIKNALSNPMTLGTIPPSQDKLTAMNELGYQHAIQFFEDPANANPALERIRKTQDLQDGNVIPYSDPMDFVATYGDDTAADALLRARSASPRRRTPSQVNLLETEIRDLAHQRKKKIVRASQVVLLLVLMRIVFQVVI
jgi:predicted acylesterase/phospholipase RssA